MSAGPRLRLHCDPTEGRGDLESEGRAFPITALSLPRPRVRTEKRKFRSSSHKGHSGRWVSSEQGRSRGERGPERDTGDRVTSRRATSGHRAAWDKICSNQPHIKPCDILKSFLITRHRSSAPSRFFSYLEKDRTPQPSCAHRARLAPLSVGMCVCPSPEQDILSRAGVLPGGRGASRLETDKARGTRVNEYGQLLPVSWLKGEGRSGQLLEKGEGFCEQDFLFRKQET